MSNLGGQPLGSKNQPSHAAGGSRANVGRPEAKKRKTDTLAPAPAMRTTKSTGNMSHTSSASMSHLFSKAIYCQIN